MSKINELWKKFKQLCSKESIDILEDELTVDGTSVCFDDGDPIDSTVRGFITASIYWWSEFEPFLTSGLITDGFSYKEIIGDAKYDWQKVIKLARTKYDQTHFVIINYDELREIYICKKSSSDQEWKDFCKWIEQLPCSEIIISENKEREDR